MDEARARRLLVISCSSRKVKTAEPVRAWGLYDGVVYRLLKRAMDEGLVRVELDLPRTEDLETALVQTL